MSLPDDRVPVFTARGGRGGKTLLKVDFQNGDYGWNVVVRSHAAAGQNLIVFYIFHFIGLNKCSKESRYYTRNKKDKYNECY